MLLLVTMLLWSVRYEEVKCMTNYNIKMRRSKSNCSGISCLNYIWSEMVIFAGWQWLRYKYTANPRAFTKKCF